MNTRKHHNLKCVQPHFSDVDYGVKSAEIRRDDRGYREGDLITLHEWVPRDFVVTNNKFDDGGDYTGKSITIVLTHVLRDPTRQEGKQVPGLMPGYSMLSFKPYDEGAE